MTATYPITHDFCIRKVVPVFEAQVGTTAQVDITLIANGFPWPVPEGAEVQIRSRRLDGPISIYRMNEWDGLCRIAGNVVSVTVPADATGEQGMISMQMVIEKDDHTIYAAQWRFNCR